jgi:hypothetical protein
MDSLLIERSSTAPQVLGLNESDSNAILFDPNGSDVIMVQEENGLWHPVRLSSRDGREDGQSGGQSDKGSLPDSLANDGRNHAF